MLFRRDIHDSHEPVPRVSLCAKHVVTDDDDDEDDALLQEGKYPAQAVDTYNFGASADESSRMQASGVDDDE